MFVINWYWNGYTPLILSWDDFKCHPPRGHEELLRPLHQNSMVLKSCTTPMTSFCWLLGNEIDGKYIFWICPNQYFVLKRLSELRYKILRTRRIVWIKIPNTPYWKDCLNQNTKYSVLDELSESWYPILPTRRIVWNKVLNASYPKDCLNHGTSY